MIDLKTLSELVPLIVTIVFSLTLAVIMEMRSRRLKLSFSEELAGVRGSLDAEIVQVKLAMEQMEAGKPVEVDRTSEEAGFLGAVPYPETRTSRGIRRADEDLLAKVAALVAGSPQRPTFR